MVLRERCRPNRRTPGNGKQKDSGTIGISENSRWSCRCWHSAEAVAFPCTVAVTEITGSESFLHLDHGSDRWVGLVSGVHDYAPGTDLTVWLDPAHVYVFAENGALVAPAAYAAAA